MDTAAKERVRASLVADLQEALRILAGQASAEQAAVRGGAEEPYTSDDLSQAEQAGNLGVLLERSEALRAANLRAVESLDFTPTDTVRPGAVVGFGGGRYVVGVACEAFECDGTTYEGISLDSPVYAQIAGLRAGDEFTVHGRRYRVELVA